MARKRAQLTNETALSTLGAGGILDRIGSYSPTTVEVQEVAIAFLEPNPFQPRQRFDDESLEELALSIRTHGFLGHLVVRKQGRGYQLAYGERRLRAAQRAGLDTIPVQVLAIEDAAMLEIALTENVQREDLHPLEEAQAYARLQNELGYSVRQIADRIGKSKSYVGSLLSLVRYADVADAVRSADIPVRTAEELAKIEDETERRRLTAKVVAGLLDREGLILARAGARERTGAVRTADTTRPLSAFNRIYRTLERHQGRKIQPDERAETATALKQIIQRATALLKEIEEEEASPKG